MKRKLFFAGVLASLASLTVLGALPVGAAERQVSIRGISGGYDPPQLPISEGDTVRWTNQDGTDHTVTSENGSFSSEPIAPGNSFSFTFPRAGTFRYFCRIGTHSLTMQGTVTVSARPSAPAQTSTPPQTQKPSPTPSPSKSPSPSPSPSESPSPSPGDVVTGTVDSADTAEEKKNEGGLSGAAIAAIVAGVVAIGSGIGLYLMRRTPA